MTSLALLARSWLRWHDLSVLGDAEAGGRSAVAGAASRRLGRPGGPPAAQVVATGTPIASVARLAEVASR